MKKLFTLMVLLFSVCSFAFTDSGVFFSPGIGFWGSNLEVSYKEVDAADYPVVTDATVKVDGSGKVPITMAAAAEAGYNFDGLSLFLKYTIASESVRLDSNDVSSKTYLNTSTGSYTTHTDYDRSSGSIWEMSLTLNASYDFLLSKDEQEGFSFYLTAGGGVDWLFCDDTFGFYTVGTWAGLYSSDSSPSASSTKIVSFDVSVPALVPVIEAGTGFRYHFDKLNSITVGVLVTYYMMPRILDNISYIQDNDGNALELIFKSKTFAPRIYISYGLNR